MNKREVIRYKAEYYYRYPDSKIWSDKCYFRCRPGKGNRYLHRQIWIDNFGAIPEGYEIHHKDKNYLNNDLSNLECLPQLEHESKHPIPEARLKWLRAHANCIRPKSIDWHSTSEGVEWHRQHGKDAYKNRQPIKKICVVCGVNFDDLTRQPTTRYCSNKCKAKGRRIDKVDNESRSCIICQKSFSVSKYSNARTCSRACSGRLCSTTKIRINQIQRISAGV